MNKEIIFFMLCAMGTSNCSESIDTAKRLVVSKQAQKTALDFISLPRDLQYIILAYVGKGWQKSENIHLLQEIDDLYFYDDALLVGVLGDKLKPIIFTSDSIDNSWITQLEVQFNKSVARLDLKEFVSLSEKEKKMPITIFSNCAIGGKETRGMGAHAYIAKNFIAIVHPMHHVIEIKNKNNAAKNIVNCIDAGNTKIDFDFFDQMRYDSVARMNKFMDQKITTLYISKDGRYIAYAYLIVSLLKSEIRIVDLQNGKKKSSFWIFGGVNHMALSPNNRYMALVTRSLSNSLHVHDIEKNHTEIIEKNEIANTNTTAVTFSPDGKYLFTGNSQGVVEKLEFQTDLDIK